MPSDRRWSDTDRELAVNTYHWAARNSCGPDNCPGAAECVYAEYLDWDAFGAVLDALTAAGWRPPPPKPDGTHWRTGTSVGRTIYNPYGDLAGLMHTAEQARAVVAALNAARAHRTTEEPTDA